MIQVPNGLDEIKKTFGDITRFIIFDGTIDPEWEYSQLNKLPLPFPIKLSWNRQQEITSLRCHKLLVGVFREVFDNIVSQGLTTKIIDFGGCFDYRAQRTGIKLSTHAWGIAIDLNTTTNLQGTDGDMDPEIIKVFQNAGFKWGGEFIGKSKDPMHFQYATGY